jgi:hypothetical protein
MGMPEGRRNSTKIYMEKSQKREGFKGRKCRIIAAGKMVDKNFVASQKINKKSLTYYFYWCKIL